MKESKRITITTTRRLQVRPLFVCAPCPVCCREVETLTRSQAAEVLEIDQLILDGLLATGQLHAIPTVGGNIRVCRTSLFV